MRLWEQGTKPFDNLFKGHMSALFQELALKLTGLSHTAWF